MDKAIAQARQVAAAEKLTANVGEIQKQLNRIEEKVDKILVLLKEGRPKPSKSNDDEAGA
jgi:hypothetical protein